MNFKNAGKLKSAINKLLGSTWSKSSIQNRQLRQALIDYYLLLNKRNPLFRKTKPNSQDTKSYAFNLSKHSRGFL